MIRQPPFSFTALVLSEARSEPDSGSEKPWHQISSAERIGSRKRSFWSSVPWAITTGPPMTRPSTFAGRGTFARAISSEAIACSIRVAPRPPNSFGQEIPAQPPPCMTFCHLRWNSNSAWSPPPGLSPGWFASSQARNSSRKASSSALSVRSINRTGTLSHRLLPRLPGLDKLAAEMTDVGDLVERGDALKTIEAALDSARAGSGSLVLVEARPMAGTSAVLAAAAASAKKRSFAIGEAQATPAGRSTAFGVARLLLSGLVAELEGDRRPLVLTGAAARAGPWLEGDFAPESADLVESLADLTARLARELGGLALAIDDAQDADPGTLRLVEALSARVGGLPLALLIGIQERVADRDDVVYRLRAQSGAVRVSLPPLSETGIATWAAARFGEPNESLARTCHELTAGSPWLVEAVFESSEGGAITALSRDSLLAEVPAIVDGRVGVELRGLDDEATSVAEALAVIGEPCGLRLAAEVADLDLDAAGRGADALAGARLVSPGEPLGFHQPLVAAAVAGRSAPFARAAMHRRAFEALESTGAPPERLAYHLLHVPAGADPASVETLRTAARAAAEMDRREHAVALLRRALEEPPPRGRHGGVLAELAMAEAAAADPRGRLAARGGAREVGRQRTWRTSRRPLATAAGPERLRGRSRGGRGGTR